MDKRNITIDALRGFAIILVVIGHTIQYTLDDFDSNMLFSIIYSFHMPLFMAISGYCAYNEKRELDRNWLLKRAKALLIPFFVWLGFVQILPLQYSLGTVFENIKKICISVDYGYWFLIVLFGESCILFALEQMISRFRLKRRALVFCATYIVLFLMKRYPPLNFANFIPYILKYYVFYMGGYLYRRYRQKICFNSMPYMIIGTVLFAFLSPLSKRDGDGLWLLWIKPYVSSWLVQNIFNSFMNSFVSVLGITASVFLIKRLPEILKHILAFVGKYTLEIYVIHVYYIGNLIPFKFDVYWLDSMVSVFLAIAWSIMVAKIIEEGMLKGLIFGKW